MPNEAMSTWKSYNIDFLSYNNVDLKNNEFNVHWPQVDDN